MNIFLHIVLIIVCYLLGSIPTAYLVVRRFTHKDVTQLGSGNIGTMNVHRATESKPLALSVLLSDMAKGAIAVILAKTVLSGSTMAPTLTTAAVLLGHNYSIYMRFQGGRGLATAAGAAAVYSPLILLTWLVIWIVPYLASKILVVGTLTAIVLNPVAAYVFRHIFHFSSQEIIFAVMISVIVLLRHISKIKMLIEGTEPKKYWKIRDDDHES